MDKLKAIALITVPVVGACLCLLLLQTSETMVSLRQEASAVAGEATTTLQAVNAPCEPVALGANPKCGLIPQATIAVDSLNRTINGVQATVNTVNRTLQLINQPCVPGSCGTLADVNKTLNTARLTMGQIEIAANHEDRNLGLMDAQEATLFADTHKAATDLDALLAAPDLLETLHHLDATSAALADSTKQADAILTDARVEADKFTHPAKKKLGFWGAIQAFAGVVHKFEPPIF